MQWKTGGLMLEMLSMQLMCWASALVPTLPPCCMSHCVAPSSKTVLLSNPQGSQAHHKSWRRGRGIQGEAFAPQVIKYVSRWISTWTGTRGVYGLCPWPSSSCYAFFHMKTWWCNPHLKRFSYWVATTHQEFYLAFFYPFLFYLPIWNLEMESHHIYQEYKKYYCL